MIDHPNYLFILANQGAGGHRLGRMISTLDSVYWYTSPKNGITPADVFLNPDHAVNSDRVSGKDISQYHYDRLVDNRVVPLVGERIECWWNQSDIDFFYQSVWTPRMTKFSNILSTHYLHWVLHDVPGPLLQRFTNAKVISLIDTDIDQVTDRYLETTAKFPSYYRFPRLTPKRYKTQYVSDVHELKRKNPKATLQDLWEYQNPDGNYVEYVRNKLHTDNVIRAKTNHPRHLTISWGDLDLEKISKFIKCQ